MKLNKPTFLISLLIACFVLTLTGCKSKENDKAGNLTASDQSFVDSLGRDIEISNPERIVVLTGSFADVLCLAGGKEKIVGAAEDTFRDFDLGLDSSVKDTGTVKEPSLETIVSLEPDLIIASSNTESQLELKETFEQMKIPTAYFQVSTFNEYLNMLDILTDITGHKENFKTYGKDVEKEINNAKKLIDGTKPKVLYIRISSSGAKVKNSENSVLGEMLKDLDTQNIADNDINLLENISMEQIALDEPEYIFIVYQSANPKDAEDIYKNNFESNKLWQGLDAVKNKRVYIMDPSLYNLKPNDKWGQAYLNLAQILYKQ